MSVTIADLMSRTSDTSRRIQRLLATFEQPAAGVRSAAARFAGLHKGLPQIRDGERLDGMKFYDLDAGDE